MVAAQTVSAMSPMDILIGEVKSVEPLKIYVGTVNAELTKDHLILTNAVTDHFVDIHVNHLTDTIHGEWDTTHSHPDAGSGTIPTDHIHSYSGRKKIKVYNGLQIGEFVVIIKASGGNSYIVLDRIGEPITEGEYLE
jgi:hypothetical protein